MLWNLLEIAGFALIALGSWFIYPPAGLIVGGVSLIVIANGFDTGSDDRSDQ